MKRPNSRTTRRTVVASVATGLLLAFAGVGLSQVLVTGPQANGGSSLSSQTNTNGHGQGNGNKVQICHMTSSKKKPGHTLWVGATAAQAHLKQHKRDHAGACTQTELHPAQATSKPKKGGGKNK